MHVETLSSPRFRLTLPILLAQVPMLGLALHDPLQLGWLALLGLLLVWFGANAAVICRTVAAHQRTDAALRTALQRLNRSQQIAHVGNWEWDIRTNDLWWSDEIFHIFGLERRTPLVTFETFQGAVHPDDRAWVEQNIDAALHHDKPYNIEHRIVLPDGTQRHVQEIGSVSRDARGTPAKMEGVVIDITERKRYEEQLAHQATHDHLTGLPNRALFRDRLQQALVQAPRHGRGHAVLFLDLDQFKNVNDTLGQEQGDLLLRLTAARLTHALREEDTVARQGDDEYSILLHQVGSAQDAAAIAEKLLAAIAQRPFPLDGQELFLTASIGITLSPQDGTDADALLNNADIAMFGAKQHGNGYRFFKPEMNAAAHERLRLESDLRRALERDQFVLYYQPQVELASGAIIGVEALLRWQHPEHGLVPPDRFIPIAEDNGLIVPIGEWVLRTACAQARAWCDAGLPLRMAVNLSARQFRQKDLTQTVAGILRETGLRPQLLDLEITESTIMQDMAGTVAKLHALKAMHASISIDDFGTGYSSLAYLRQFPINSLKVDRSFMKNATTSADDAAIVAAVISLAHSLGLRVVAEGVETAEQAQFLRKQSCDEFQGFLCSRPLPAGELELLLQAPDKALVNYS